MKKEIKLLFALFILLMPFIVKADMGAPIVRSYEAIVIKADGIDYYAAGSDWDFTKKGHLDKDTKITVDFEMTSKDTTYLSFEYDDDIYYVRSEDVEPLDKEVSYKDSAVDKYEETFKVKVEAKDGVPVRKGPSAAYDVINTLDKGTVGKTKYYIEESGYIYIETDKVSGWVDTLEGAVLFYGGDYVVAEEIKLDCATIPIGTKIKDAWYTDMWSGNILLTYKGCSDYYHWFKQAALVEAESYTGDIKNKATIYEKPTMKKEIGTIPKGANVKVLSGTYIEDDYDPNIEPKIYVEYEGKKGWIVYKENLFSNVKEYVEEKEEPKEEEEPKEDKEEKAKDENKDEDKDDDDDEEKENKLDTKTIVTICLFTAGAFVLGSVAAIVLVNVKKKKVKNEEQINEENK